MFNIIRLNHDNINQYISELSLLEKNNFNNEAYTKDLLYSSINEYDNIIVLLDEDILIGYAIYRTLDIIHLFKIYIKTEYRRNSYAKGLLDYIIENSKTFNKIYIEVRKNNINALNFYDKNGFKIINQISNFYQNPKDDAIIMEKYLGE